MKKNLLAAFAALFTCLTAFATEVTRTVELFAENPSAVFAVPNGFSFTRAHAYDAQGGSVPVSVGEPTTMNHVTLVPVAVNGEGVNGEKVTVSVVFEDNGPLFTGRPAKVMRQAIKEKVANPDDVPTTQYVAPSRSRLKLAASGEDAGADVLILAPHDNVALWQQYATFRQSTAVGADHDFLVVDLNDVYAAYPWTGDRPSEGVRNAAESIHKYLRENRDNLGLSYVILGGSWIDAQFINANGDWERNGNVVKTLDGNNMSLTNAVPGIIAYPRNANEDIPSDMFYACLDLKAGQTYPWIKGTATRYYETFQNEADRAEYDSGVDVVVSRIAFKPLEFTIPQGARILDKYAETMHVGESHLFTPAELMDYWCEKLRRAEAENFTGMGRMGFSWGDFNYTKRPLDGSLPEEYEFYDDIPNMFSRDRQTDFYGNLEQRHRQRIKTIVAPSYPIRELDGRCEHGTTWTKGLESASAAQAHFLATDHDFNVVAMHGWAGGSAWYHVEDTYNQTGIILFNDMSFPCETGWPDFVNDKTSISQPCCGEATIAAPFGGSVASVNNTRSGWAGGIGQLSDQHNVNSYKGFLQEGHNVGQTWLNAHLDFAGITASAAQSGFASSNTGGTGAWVLSEHILYGDPLVKTQAAKEYSTAQSTFPMVAKSAVLASEVSVSGVNAVVTATTAGDIVFNGTGRMKITKVLEVSGSSVTINDGIDGGITLVKFTGSTPGTITINTTKRFYLGGVENCASIVVNGNGAIIDCDHIDSTLTSISFTMQDGAANTLRGVTVGALAHVAINATGGSLVFESHDLLGGTTVTLEGTTVKLAGDPKIGALVASGEPLRATFVGSGRIEYQHGTELLRQWTIEGQIALVELGELAIGFDYTAALGSNPTGWFSSWGGEGFDDTEAYLAPRGFVHVVKNGKHPHASLPAKTGFTMALYANLVKVENSNAVLLSYGNKNNADSQILLIKNGNKIQLAVTGSYGGAAVASVEADYPGAGYHLYIIERKGNELSLRIDDGVKQTITRAFTLSSGLQIGSQFGGLNGRNKAIGMAVAGLRGYDAILTDDEMSALIAEFPAMPPPITVDADVELNVEGVEARLINATITDGHYLGGSNGDLYVPDTVTVNVQGFKLNNTSRSADDIVANVYGRLNVTGKTTQGPYDDMRNPETMAGIMLGHWAGTSTLNIHTGGLVNAPNGELLMGYSTTGHLNINGGKLVVRSITNYSRPRGVRRDGCPITITNGGTLEIADWPCQNQTAPGTMPITIDGGTIKATADWTCPWPLTVSGPLTIDANGHKLVFLGAISGSGKITVIDSSEAKIGSVLFSGDLTNYNNTIRVSSEVTAIGVRAGQETKLDFAGYPAKLMVALSSTQLNADYDATAFASRVTDGATVEFTDYSGYDYQSIPGTTRYTQWSPMPYVYDDITWGNVYLPYERGIWEPLINWREFKTQTVNGETYTKAIQKYTSGAAPQATSNCGRWDPIILNGDEFEGEKGEDGFYDVHVDYLEGWLIRLGLYNGVHLYVENLNKVQRGGASNPTPYIRVGANSRLTIAKCGTGNTDVTIPLYVASSDGIVFKTNVFDKNFEYYLTEGGSVKFESGVSAGTHKVKEVHATAGDATGAYYNLKGVKVADFNNKGSTARFTSEDSALKLAGYAGTTRYLANSLAVLSDAQSNGLGGFTLMQGDAGVYAMYAEKSVTPPTEITINGNQTALDLANLPYDTITKIKIAGAWGYFKGEDHTISTQVEFNDTAAGLPAFRWENGYGSKYVAFENATGHGTIFINGGTRTSQAMFFKGGDFDGSIILTNGNNRVFFGTPTAVQQASASRIEVKSGATANLKDGGIWAASELAINGTLVCKGRADVICFGGITGVDHIEILDGYAKSVMTIGGNVARVWVLPQGEVPQAEGQLNFQFGAVTIPSFDMGDHLLKVTSGTVTLEEDAVVIAPRLEVDDEASFVAAAKVGDTYYGSFAKAAEAANNGEKTIILLSNVENFNLEVGQRLVLDKNGHTISFANGLTVEETANDDGSVSYLSTSTRYTIVYHVKDTDGSDLDVSDLTPTSFATERLPIDLPLPTATDKVFHGWYAMYEGGEYSDGPQTRIERMARDNELHLYGYWLAAVATVKGVPYDNWQDAIDAQRNTGYSIVALDTSRLPAGYFVNEAGHLVQLQATVQVGDTTTHYSSFAAARAFAKGKEGAVITLITDSPSDLVLDDGETVLVNLNGYSLEVEAAHPENYNVHSSYDENTWITTYWTTHRDVVITLPELPEGVTATVTANGITIDANESGNYVVPYNATVTITYSVEGAFTLNKTSETITADSDKIATDFVAPVKTAAVAQRGHTYYASVQAALSAANGSTTVTVLNNPEASTITIPSGITLDCNGKAPIGGYSIISNGGTIRTSASGWNANSQVIKALTLNADTEITGYTIGVGMNGAETTLALDEHTLTVTTDVNPNANGTANFYLRNTTIYGSGTLKVTKGRLLVYGTTTGTEATLDIECSNADIQVSADLTVKNFFFAGSAASGTNTIIISNEATIAVASSAAITFNPVLAGNCAVTKTGAGSITFAADNTFTGGLYVNEGTAKTAAGKKGFGPYDDSIQTTCDSLSLISVAEGAMLDVAGIGGRCYRVELAGEMTNRGNEIGTTQRQISAIKVIGDNARITGADHYALLMSGYEATKLDLNEHNLEIAMNENKIFHLRTTTLAGTGTVKITSGQLHLTTGTTLANDSNIKFVIMPGATLDDGVNVIDVANISTPNDANKIVRNGYVYSVAEKAHYAVTLGEHAHATVVGLPETTIREDAEPIEFTVAVDEGYEIIAVKANGVALDGDGAYSHKVASDTTITVETVLKTFTVTAATAEGLSVNATSVTANYDETITITYTLAENYILKSGELVQSFTYADSTQVAAVPTVVKAQTKIGDRLYETPSAALAAAQSGETVTVISQPVAEPITIPAGVTLDIGYHGYNDNSGVPNGGYVITAKKGAVIRGGTYNAHNVTIKSLTLNGDCSIGTESSPLTDVFGFGTGANGKSSITLNGNTLHVWGADNTNFFFETTTVTDAGTINMHKGRLMTHCTSFAAEKTKLVFSGNSTAAFEAGATVGELEIATTGTLTINDNQRLTIANQDTKNYLTAAEMHKISLGSGATFDYGWQPGKVISINFNAGSSTDAKWMSGDEVDMTFAGKVPRNSWVNTTGGNGTNVAVGQCWDSDANETQTISGMTISYSSSGTYSPSSATLPFMKGYLDIANYAGGVDRVTLNLAGIPFKKYDVIVYFQGDGNHGFRPVQVTHNFGATTEEYGYNSAFEVVKEGYTDPWGQSNQAEISYEKNALRINGLVGSVLKVEPLPRSTVRASVAAIQIVENTEGVITYRRNPEATSNDWMVEDGWLLPDGTPVTWQNPDLASGQIYTAEIDADQVSDIKLTSQVSASSVIVTSTTAREFKFLTDEDLGHVATPDDNPKSILNAPVDATGFKGALYLQSRISGAISMGTQMHITFVAMDEGVETTAYPYEFVGNLSTITKIGLGIFRVPQSMAGVPYNIEAGYILYDYEGVDTVQLGKVTGNGTAILKSSNLQLAADNTAALDWQSDYLKVAGNLFASGSTKTLNIPTDKTVEVIDNADQTGARDNVYTGSGTLVFGGNGGGYHLLNANSLPAGSLTMQLENSKGLIIPGNGITLSNITGSKGFRSDYDASKTARPVNFVQSKSTIWFGNFVCGNNPDRIGTVTVSGANGATEKTLTLAGDYSSVDNTLVVDASGSVKLTGTWKGNVTVDGEFGGSGSITAGSVIIRDYAVMNVDFGTPDLSSATSLSVGAIVVKGANLATGSTVMTGVPSTVNLQQMVTINDQPGYTLVVEDGKLKVGGLANLRVTIPEVVGTTASVEGYEIVNGVVTVPYGASITITYAANEGFDVTGMTSLTLENITSKQTPSAPDLTATIKPNQMLYCFHLDGNADNVGIMGTSGVTEHGTSTWSTNSKFEGEGNKSYTANDSDKGIVVENTSGIATWESGWTISMWIQPEALGTWRDIAGFTIGKVGYRIEKTGGKALRIYNEQGKPSYDLDLATYSDNSDWVHMAFVANADGKSFDVYANGIFMKKYAPVDDETPLWGTAAGAVHGLTKVSIGQKGIYALNGTNALDGNLDEVAVFNAALSANQIAWLAANAPSTDVFDVSAHSTPFGTKVIGLNETDECQFWSEGETIKSRVTEKYKQVVVTLLIKLPETTTATKIVTVNESSTDGGSGNTADLWWDGSKLYFGYNRGNTDVKTAVTVEPGLHLISMTVINGQIQSGNCGVNVVVDGDATNKKATKTNIRWGSNYPTGTFTYQGDIKSITLDFSSSDAVSGLDALPKFTQGGVAVTDLATIEEILTMSGASIGSDVMNPSTGTVPADVTMGSFVETGSADTIGITVGTALDLPNGKVTILVEDENNKGTFVELAGVDLTAPTADPTLHDARNQLIVPISSLLNGAKSRLFKLKVSPK